MNETPNTTPPEGKLELTHVHHTDTGLTATHATLMALAGWIQQVVDRWNAMAEPADGEVDAIENPLAHLLQDDRTQMVRPAGRLQLINMLYEMRDKTTGDDPVDVGDTNAEDLRRLAGELATTLRCLHHVRENDYVLLVIE